MWSRFIGALPASVGRSPGAPGADLAVRQASLGELNELVRLLETDPERAVSHWTSLRKGIREVRGRHRLWLSVFALGCERCGHAALIARRSPTSIQDLEEAIPPRCLALLEPWNPSSERPPPPPPAEATSPRASGEG